MDIGSLIGNYAFPIVACLGMGWYVKYITDKNSKETEELNKQHTEIMLAYKDEIKNAINNNTLAMQRLCDRIDYKEKRGEKDEVI